MKAVVLINLSSNNGNAYKKWMRIKSDILKRLPDDTIYICYELPVNFKNLLKSLVENTEITHFVSAGGDGSIHLLINTLAEISPGLESFTIGAVGLGSSNDFLKPTEEKIKGIPVKLNFSNAKKTDLGKVIFSDNSEKQMIRYFAINASLGFTAEGNNLFNQGDRVIRYLKTRSINLAIIWTVLKTLLYFRNKKMTIKFNGTINSAEYTNISVAKNPNVSGSFKYDTSTTPDSGLLGLYLAENFSKVGIVSLLFCLSFGHFSRQKNCHVSMIEELEIILESSAALETDGEIYFGSKFKFSVTPKAISVAV